jgi:hypothetical protein
MRMCRRVTNELSRFYGSLAEPLELLDLQDMGKNRFVVRYRYATKCSRCEGSATVRTTEQDGRYFIKGIRADGRC